MAERCFLTRLAHPNIVRIVDFVTHLEPDSGELTGYIVMKYVYGLPLSEARDITAQGGDPMGGPLRVEHFITYGIEALGAFAYPHGQGLVYCDMKPSNVLRGRTQGNPHSWPDNAVRHPHSRTRTIPR